jgi:phosphoribosylglycinamide formyltransferase-1
LPAFGGLIGIEPIKRAYDQGCKYIGPTCHFVDEGVDTGKILAQGVFTTDRSFNDAVTIMFRTGCLVLLNGLTILLNNPIPENINQNIIHFSPKLNFDASFFNEDFWQKVEDA